MGYKIVKWIGKGGRIVGVGEEHKPSLINRIALHLPDDDEVKKFLFGRKKRKG